MLKPTLEVNRVIHSTQLYKGLIDAGKWVRENNSFLKERYSQSRLGDVRPTQCMEEWIMEDCLVVADIRVTKMSTTYKFELHHTAPGVIDKQRPACC